MPSISDWFGWRKQDLDLTPGEHTTHHLIHRLHSFRVTGNQRIVSSEIIARQQESIFIFLYCFWESSPCYRNCFLIDLRLSSSTREGMLFQIEGLNSLCYCWSLSYYTCGISFVKTVSLDNMKDQKRNWIWSTFAYSFTADKGDRCHISSV